MASLSEVQRVTEWTKFFTVFSNLHLAEKYDCDQLQKELCESPCAASSEYGTAYKGALLVHINLTMALAQRIAKMVSGTFQIDDEQLLKICCIMHLSKRHLYIENDNEWEIKNRNMLFKFAKKQEGLINGGERSALEALNNGVKLSPIEFEAITCLDNDEQNCARKAFMSIYSTIVRQANEMAYAIERERYKKLTQTNENKNAE